MSDGKSGQMSVVQDPSPSSTQPDATTRIQSRTDRLERTNGTSAWVQSKIQKRGQSGEARDGGRAREEWGCTHWDALEGRRGAVVPVVRSDEQPGGRKDGVRAGREESELAEETVEGNERTP